MGKYWDWSIEYNPCLYCSDRRCDCSTHEDDVNEKCVSCRERKCKVTKCDKWFNAVNKYNKIK